MRYVLASVPIVVLALFLGTCAPPPPATAPDGQYAMLAPPDSLYMPGDSRITSDRLLVEGDSVRFFTPVWGMGPKMPVYAGDSTMTFPDSLYGLYTFGADSTLQFRIRQPDTTFSLPQRYALANSEPWTLPGPEVVGKTYRFDVEGVRVLVYFWGAPERPLASLVSREGQPDSRFEFRRPRTVDYPGDRRTSSLSYVETIETNRVRVHRLLITAAEDGTPQLDLIADLGGRKREHRGPFPATVYPSPVPDSIPDQNLFMQLSRGRIEVLDIPPPDAPFGNRDMGALSYEALTPEELRGMGFEFREDGYFSVFVADRILVEGGWQLAEDRNFILIRAGRHYSYAPRLITEYTAEYLTFSLPLRVGSEEGPYLADVAIRFYAP